MKMLIRLGMLLAAIGACLLAFFIFGPGIWLFNEAQPPESRAATLADLDGDGDLDAILANGKSESQVQNTTWINQGGLQTGKLAQFLPGTQKLGLGEFNTVTPGDLDRDGDVDLLAVTRDGIKIFMDQGGRQGGRR